MTVQAICSWVFISPMRHLSQLFHIKQVVANKILYKKVPTKILMSKPVFEKITFEIKVISTNLLSNRHFTLAFASSDKVCEYETNCCLYIWLQNAYIQNFIICSQFRKNGPQCQDVKSKMQQLIPFASLHFSSRRHLATFLHITQVVANIICYKKFI